MNPRRATASPPPSASDAAPLTGVLGSPAAPLSLAALPADLLISIFLFAPLGARLRAIGLVCKRWRALVLRAVRAVRRVALTGAEEADATIDTTAGAALPLFPSLTWLSLRHVDFDSQRLPTTLTRLELTLTAWRADGVLSAHLPHLAALCLLFSYRSAPGSSERIGAFIARHCATLEHLALKSMFDYQLAGLHGHMPREGLPCVRTLKLRGSDPAAIAGFIWSAPQLQSLSLTMSETVLLSVPHSLLTSLVSLRGTGVREPPSDLVALLQRLPKLRKVNLGYKVAPELSHIHTSVALPAATPWESLCRYPNVRSLCVASEWQGTVTALPLPHLRQVHLQRSPAASASDLLALVSDVLEAYPGLSLMSLLLRPGHGCVLEAVSAKALRCGLRRLIVYAPAGEIRTVPAAIPFGWLRFSLDTELYPLFDD